jgi:hypothetical protein
MTKQPQPAVSLSNPFKYAAPKQQTTHELGLLRRKVRGSQ